MLRGVKSGCQYGIRVPQDTRWLCSTYICPCIRIGWVGWNTINIYVESAGFYTRQCQTRLSPLPTALVTQVSATAPILLNYIYIFMLMEFLV